MLLARIYDNFFAHIYQYSEINYCISVPKIMFDKFSFSRIKLIFLFSLKIIQSFVYSASQLEELQDEMKRKESRWNSSTSRLKNRLAEMELENGELKEEVRILEKKRLEWMTQQSQAKAVERSQVNGKVSLEGSTVKTSNGGRGAQVSYVNDLFYIYLFTHHISSEHSHCKAISFNSLKYFVIV